MPIEQYFPQLTDEQRRAKKGGSGKPQLTAVNYEIPSGELFPALTDEQRALKKRVTKDPSTPEKVLGFEKSL
ncbi:hypothetical protein A2685_02075 [Candidatus Woesebacteria bacterium RIFCSPHIGHO2_01_FULL_37_10]|uniref:Uncharacterized protein n=1 Tax=Candidatus Woesebacteria bacterium RIFCSPHIGHO2_01_FULL_37_10 TaxID=1802489 RepID=A0A1F7XV19_9BACT|nr:MAG: hypothetical protein A2685_02075 [Candidatus Woesebacteria bacterium RIFCSPHIGHO2_01_FULL_37_10]